MFLFVCCQEGNVSGKVQIACRDRCKTDIWAFNEYKVTLFEESRKISVFKQKNLYVISKYLLGLQSFITVTINFFFVWSFLYGTARSRIFYRTHAGYTAKRKTRRKRNRGCQGLLSVAHQPQILSQSRAEHFWNFQEVFTMQNNEFYYFFTFLTSVNNLQAKIYFYFL